MSTFTYLVGSAVWQKKSLSRNIKVFWPEHLLQDKIRPQTKMITFETTKLGKHRKLPDFPDIKTFKCHQEVTEPDRLTNSNIFKLFVHFHSSRSGFIQSTRLTYTNGTCSLVFRGEQRDLVLLSLDTLVLRWEIKSNNARSACWRMLMCRCRASPQKSILFFDDPREHQE